MSLGLGTWVRVTFGSVAFTYLYISVLKYKDVTDILINTLDHMLRPMTSLRADACVHASGPPLLRIIQSDCTKNIVKICKTAVINTDKNQPGIS